MSTFLVLISISVALAAGTSGTAPAIVATAVPLTTAAVVATVPASITVAPTLTAAAAAASTPSPLTDYMYPYNAIVSNSF